MSIHFASVCQIPNISFSDSITRGIHIRNVINCIFSIICRIRFNIGDAMKHDQCLCAILRLIDKCCVVKWWFATLDSLSINICLNGIQQNKEPPLLRSFLIYTRVLLDYNYITSARFLVTFIMFLICTMVYFWHVIW